MVTVNEAIRVAAIHGPGPKLRPVWFDWKARKHLVREVAYQWQHSVGRELMYHYAVSDGCALYELVYNASRQTWLLCSIEADCS